MDFINAKNFYVSNTQKPDIENKYSYTNINGNSNNPNDINTRTFDKLFDCIYHILYILYL